MSITNVSVFSTADASTDGVFNDGVPEGDENRKSSIERALLRAKIGLFGVLFVMSKETVQNPTTVLFEMLVDFLQVLSFPFASVFPWNPAWTDWLSTATRITRFHWYLEISTGLTNAIFYIALAAVLLVLMNAGYVGVAFSRRKPMNMVLVRTLRSVTSLFVTVLFLPLIDIFSARFSCNSDHLEVDSSTCAWAGSEIVIKVVGIVTIILLTTLSLSVEATFFDDNPESKGILSRPHARIDVAYLLYKALISILDSTLDLHKSSQQWAFVAVLTLGSFLFAYLYTWYPAYYRFRFSRMRALLQWCIAWATVALVITKITNNPDNNAAPLLFFVGLPLAALAGGLAIAERRRILLNKHVTRIASPYEIELKVRFMLEPLVSKRRLALLHAEDTDTDAAAEQERLTLVAQADEVYRRAIKIIGTPSILLVFQSQFYYSIARNTVLGARALAKASRLPPFSLDEEFFLFRRQQTSQEYFASGASESKDVVAYMTFIQSVQAARSAESKCLQAQTAFWATLLQPQPDSTRLREISSVISRHITIGQAAFHTLLRVSPDSPQVCRMYSNWLGTIMYDQDKKLIYQNRATVLESSRDEDKQVVSLGGALAIFDDGVIRADDSKHAKTINGGTKALKSSLNVDGMRDGVSAVLGLVSDEDHFGFIASANPAAARLFGYTRHDLLGQQVGNLTAMPFAGDIERAALAYISSGDLAIRGTRNVFFRHKNGYIFPGRLTIKEIPGTGVLPTFVAIAEPMDSKDAFVLVDPATGVVTGYTANCLVVFGIRIEELMDKTVSIADWIPDYAGMRTAMASYGGAPFSISDDVDSAYPAKATIWESQMGEVEDRVLVIRIRRDEAMDEQPPLLLREKPALERRHSTGINGSLSESFDSTNARVQQHPRSSLRNSKLFSRQNTRDEMANASRESSLPSLPVWEDPAKQQRKHTPVKTANYSKDARMPVVDDRTISFEHGGAAETKGENADEQSAHEHKPHEIIELEEIRPRNGSVVLEGLDALPSAGDGQNSDMDESRSSSSRQSSRGRRVNALRRTLVNANNGGLARSLQAFRVVVVLTLAAILSVAIASYVVEKQQVSEFQDAFASLNAAAEIRFQAVSAGYITRRLSFANTGLRPSTLLAPSIAQLSSIANSLEDGYKAITARVPKMSAQHRLLFETPSVDFISDFTAAGQTIMRTTLGEALKTTISRVRQITRTNLTGHIAFDPLFVVPIVNGLETGSLSRSFNASSAFTLKEVDDQIRSMREVYVALAVSGLTVVFALTAFVILPTVIYVERASEHTLRVFENVPRETVRKMRRKCTKKLKELQTEDENSDSNSDDDSERHTHRRGSNAVAVSKSKSAQNQPVRMRFRRAPKYVAIMGLKISTFLILGVLFFSLSYYFGFLRIENSLRDGAVRVNYAGYIRTTTRSLTWLGYEYNVNTAGQDLSAQVDNATADLSEIVRGLEIGSAVFRIPPRSNVESAHAVLLDDNACIAAQLTHKDYSDCMTAGDGIFANGLNQAMLWYIRRMGELKVVPPVNTTGEYIFTAANNPQIIQTQDYEERFVQPALALSASYYTDSTEKIIRESKNIVLALLVMFVVLSIVAYFAVYARLIVALDTEMKRTRSMMLMLPEEALMQMEAYVSKLAAETTVHTSRV